MIEVVEQPTFIKTVLGGQSITFHAIYRPLHFLIEEICADGVLIYNTLTKNLLLLEKQEYAILKNGGAYKDEMKSLIESYLLVPIDFDEVKCFEQLQKVYNLFDKETYINSFVILPTTDCNARCFYCCEKGQKRVDMDGKTAHDTAKFIIDQCQEKKVSIMWFGGEPLYCIKPINIICDILKEYKVTFTSNMISNAYLFDEALVHTAKDNWNVRSIQVTLDGTQEVYNKTKAYIYKNDDNPFERVIRNIFLLSKQKIHVIIRLNMDLFNEENLYRLVDDLYSRFGGNEYVKIYVRLLFDNTSTIQLNRTDIERKILYSKLEKFEDYIADRGLLHVRPVHSVYTTNTCIGTNKHGTVITPTGELGLCDLRTDDFLYGNIHDGIRDQAVIEDFMVRKPKVNNCDTCAYFPNCFRLKKCMYYVRDCEEYEQNKMIRNMKRTILYTYQQFKRKTDGN